VKKLTRDEAAIVQSCCFQPHYSGDGSVTFWKAVNRASDDRTLYDFACALQDVESRVLAVVNGYVRERATKTVIAPAQRTAETMTLPDSSSDLGILIKDLRRAATQGLTTPAGNRALHPRSLLLDAADALEVCLASHRVQETQHQGVDTYTPLFWITLNDDEKYVEYIRVRLELQAATRAQETPGDVMSVDEARSASVDALRTDLIRSAARGQGPTFIAAKLDLLIARAQETLHQEIEAWRALSQRNTREWDARLLKAVQRAERAEIALSEAQETRENDYLVRAHTQGYQQGYAAAVRAQETPQAWLPEDEK
jgi:hypothetical protein